MCWLGCQTEKALEGHIILIPSDSRWVVLSLQARESNQEVEGTVAYVTLSLWSMSSKNCVGGEHLYSSEHKLSLISFLEFELSHMTMKDPRRETLTQVSGTSRTQWDTEVGLAVITRGRKFIESETERELRPACWGRDSCTKQGVEEFRPWPEILQSL